MPADGRKLVVLHGHGICDEFVMSGQAGLIRRLIPALQHMAARHAYDIVFSFDRHGHTSFGSDAIMREKFDALVQRHTAVREGEQTIDLESDDPSGGHSGSPAANAADTSSSGRVNEGEARGQTRDVADEHRLRNLIGQLGRAFDRSDVNVLAIFEHPEDLWLGDLPAAAAGLLRETVRLAHNRKGAPSSKLVCIVRPGRHQEFLQALELVETTAPVLNDVEIGTPGREEIAEYFDARNVEAISRLVGDRERLFSEWIRRSQLLDHLGEAIRQVLSTNDNRPVAVESILQRGTVQLDPQAVSYELDSLIGLATMKQRIQTFMSIVQQRVRDREEGRPIPPPNTHMLFLGNPGTGKTVVARLVGRYLQAIGLRSTGRFVEISRTDIASQYNSGECLQRMRQAIDRAAGGVLFIDEAYQLAEGEWMRAALETLMKDMEDRVESLTVILAGYEESMQKLWSVNPGFRSRIPEENWLRFPDYNTDELVKMFSRECERRHYQVRPEIATAAAQVIDAEVRRGQFANGRGVRNLMDRVERNRATAGGGELSVGMIPLPPRFDADAVSGARSNLESQLSGLPGLTNYLDEVASNVARAEKRGLHARLPHCRIVGAPGTGKTTAARGLGAVFRAMGLVSRGHCIELNPTSALAGIETTVAIRVADRFSDARGGVLLLDDADQIASHPSGGRFFDELIHYANRTDFADTVIILTGYRDRINRTIEQHPGLATLLSHEIDFHQLPLDSLIDLFNTALEPCVVDVEVKVAFDNRLRQLLTEARFDPLFANARTAKSLASRVLDRQHQRVGTGAMQFGVITEDLGAPAASLAKVMEKLASLEDKYVGMTSVKDQIRRMIQTFRLRAARGEPPLAPPRLLFLGNPGTGKTSVARELAYVLRTLGSVATDRFVETRGVELKAAYVGQSKDRVIHAFRDARGGVLFIDEVYALNPRNYQQDNFAGEAIDAIVGQTELPENSRTMVILAGYTRDMKTFLHANAGLASRFPESIMFPNYSHGECVEILRRWLTRVEPEVPFPIQEDAVYKTVLKAFEDASMREHFGNARDAESLGRRILATRDYRLIDVPNEQLIEQSALNRHDFLEGTRLWLESKIYD